MEENKITAGEGKIFADMEGSIIGKTIYLGIHDSADNYVEVDEPAQEEQ